MWTALAKGHRFKPMTAFSSQAWVLATTLSLVSITGFPNKNLHRRIVTYCARSARLLAQRYRLTLKRIEFFAGVYLQCPHLICRSRPLLRQYISTKQKRQQELLLPF